MLHRRPYTAELGIVRNNADPNHAVSTPTHEENLDEQDAPHQQGQRENPFDAPGQALYVSDSDLTEQLESVLAAIDALPSEFKRTLPRYFDPELITDLRRVTRAMRKLRNNTRPYYEEILAFADADSVLAPLAKKFRNAAERQNVAKSIDEVIRSKIVAILTRASSEIEWKHGGFGVAHWAEEVADTAEHEPIAPVP